jgi:hypothetical protein
MAGRHACVRAVSAAGADITPASSEVGAPTVAEQWQAQHGVTLLQPQLPCLDVGSGAAPEWVPAELCRWVGVGEGEVLDWCMFLVGKVGALFMPDAACMHQLLVPCSPTWFARPAAQSAQFCGAGSLLLASEARTAPLCAAAAVAASSVLHNQVLSSDPQCQPN